MRTFTKVIPANGSIELREKGSFFKIRTTTGALEVFSGDQVIRLDSVGAGQGFKGIRFNQLFFVNHSAADVTARIAIGEAGQGELIDSIQIASDAQIAETPCNTYTALEEGAAWPITVTTTPGTADPLPAGARHVILKASPSNTDVILVGSIPLDAGDVLPLNLGEGAVIDYVAVSGSQTLYGMILID